MKESKVKIIIISILTMLCFACEQSADITSIKSVKKSNHPRVLIRAEDKNARIDAIHSNDWMKLSLEKLKNKVEPYADRHLKDPEWILSRMLMHRKQHYTHFPLDTRGEPRKNRWVNYLDKEKRSGHAPVPTIKVATFNGTGTLSDHSAGKIPELKDYPVYHVGDTILVESRNTPGLKEEVELGNHLHWWNRKISDLGAQSGTLYFLTGEEKYARLAADIFMQWALAVYYQEPFNHGAPEEPSMTSYFGGQDLGDYNYKTMAISYDFAFDYLIEHQEKYLAKLQSEGHLLGESISSIADQVFYKFLNNTLHNGLAQFMHSPNNHSMKNSELIWMGLAIDDAAKREEIINRFLHKNESLRTYPKLWDDKFHLGSVPWDLFFERAIDDNGLWKEPPGYHAFPMRAAVRVAAALDVNGYQPWTNYPELLKAQYAYFRFSFPDSTTVQFGDSSASMYPDAINLEFAIAGARRNNLAIEEELTAYLQLLIDKGIYQREADYKQILYYVPELKETKAKEDIYSRSDAIDFASLYLQRNNGTDQENGMMYQVNSGQYIHHQFKGIDLELYGKGRVQGVHSGVEYPYNSKIMREYYVRSGAANTVIPNEKELHYGNHNDDNNKIKLVDMEPMPGLPAKSKYYSFTEVDFDYLETKQKRLTVLVNLPRDNAFYLDIFRSDDPVLNDYIYNNVGQKVTLLDPQMSPLSFQNKTLLNSEAVGYQYLTDQQISETRGNVIALFEDQDSQNGLSYMKVFFPKGDNRQYITATAPLHFSHNIIKAPPSPHKRKSVVVRQHGNAWDNPFVAVFEPTRNTIGSVESVTTKNLDSKKDSLVEVDIITKDYIVTVIHSVADESIEVINKQSTGRLYISTRHRENNQHHSSYSGSLDSFKVENKVIL